ncbi:hypothetical protein JTB14_001430 [Gonioctena quinquepunctata]|nr:hypothetical protein JTB14_001430 [Gonioctena quinquepunctata]
MEEIGLKVAVAQEEIAALTGERKMSESAIKFEKKDISMGREIKYLEVYRDKGMSMTIHVEKTCEKANKVLSNLTSIMTNVDGTRTSKRIHDAK